MKKNLLVAMLLCIVALAKSQTTINTENYTKSSICLKCEDKPNEIFEVKESAYVQMDEEMTAVTISSSVDYINGKYLLSHRVVWVTDGTVYIQHTLMISGKPHLLIVTGNLMSFSITTLNDEGSDNAYHFFNYYDCIVSN